MLFIRAFGFLLHVPSSVTTQFRWSNFWIWSIFLSPIRSSHHELFRLLIILHSPFIQLILISILSNSYSSFDWVYHQSAYPILLRLCPSIINLSRSYICKDTKLNYSSLYRYYSNSITIIIITEWLMLMYKYKSPSWLKG